jgi:hypothetical protein
MQQPVCYVISLDILYSAIVELVKEFLTDHSPFGLSSLPALLLHYLHPSTEVARFFVSTVRDASRQAEMVVWIIPSPSSNFYSYCP